MAVEISSLQTRVIGRSRKYQVESPPRLISRVDLQSHNGAETMLTYRPVSFFEE